MAPELHFGLGKEDLIKELKVVWFDGKIQRLNNVEVNQKLQLNYSDAKIENNNVTTLKKMFVSDTSGFFPPHKHVENKYDDFKDQVLLPHKMSTFGPALAIGDLNGDGLDDYFIGGSTGKVGSIYIQSENGFKKKESSFLEVDKECEDIGALLFDADNDGDNDLYVVSGGYEFDSNSENLQDRLYINDGRGAFSKASEGTLPKMISSGSKVYNADFDNDGKQDLLVLGRQVPGSDIQCLLKHIY